MLIDIEELTQTYYNFLDFKSDKYRYVIYHSQYDSSLNPIKFKIVNTLREVGLFVLYDCNCADEYFQMANHELNRGVVYFPLTKIKHKTLIARIYMTWIYFERSRINIYKQENEDQENKTQIRFLNARFGDMVERMFHFEFNQKLIAYYNKINK